jgi:hypothetical protein
MNFGSIFFFYRFFQLPIFFVSGRSSNRLLALFPAGQLHSNECPTQHKNRAEQTFSLPQIVFSRSRVRSRQRTNQTCGAFV